MKVIYTRKGEEVLVDDDDYELLSQFTWWTQRGYVVRRVNNGTGRIHHIMHRIVMDAPKGMEVDHINGNRLDNRKCNLRICTRQQNGSNRRKRHDSLSQYKGISYNKADKRWGAYICKDQKLIWLGSFKNELDAATAYDRAAIEIHGEYARTNGLVCP